MADGKLPLDGHLEVVAMHVVEQRGDEMNIVEGDVHVLNIELLKLTLH